MLPENTGILRSPLHFENADVGGEMVIFNQEKCILCRKCMQDCYPQAIQKENEKMTVSGECMLCGHCVAICPKGAVSICDYEDEPEEYIKEKFQIESDNMLHMIKFRRSIRNYREKIVEREKLEMMIEAGRYTATVSNRQEISYIVVQDKKNELKHMVLKKVEQYVNGENAVQWQEKLFRNASVIIYIVGDNAINAGLAAQNMELMAATLGLGIFYNGYLTKISGSFTEIREFLQIGEKEIQLCFMAGYPAVEYRRTAPRKKPEILWM